ncbi:unnamed protein product [Enterobius vermicularis]|uniref:Uncharacterized protein n=1 Tax=Enterobius vermicularis TaxID=51028 RepID=A0A3P6IUF6_ENTVE|nr:unnamed protein product [Enterobius vermicularis]
MSVVKDRETQCGGQRNNDTDRNLPPFATHLLAKFRRDADASTDKADRG